MKTRRLHHLGCLAALALAGQPALAADVTVSITNLSHGNHFTSLLISAHDDMSHVFQPGMTASANLRAMAECGNISGLLTDLGGTDMDTVENPAGGLLAPGASTSTNLMTGTGNTHLSLVAMILPTNDGFVGIDSLEIPTAAGTYTYYLNAWDAGTEANDELIPNTECMPGVAGIPIAPAMDGGSDGTGVATSDSNDKVHIHRGILGDSNAVGGVSDLNNTIHRWQNPIAKLVLTIN